MGIAARLRRHRQAAGLTQGELAQKIGANTQQIHRYETGAGRIPAAQLFQIAAALTLPIDAFFDPSPVTPSSEDALMRDTRIVAGLLRELGEEEREAVIKLIAAMARPL
ncbi:helix-turn-helix transcriptional regulator [Salipiger sp. 1_MG-2023]|uniref:helix-turn-helix domain-containing protein n=1 Tax=Salipiger sp. 1_MG-2023 TaxID=3062665 RepID=UPI0026E376C7|nr:helix-turn-helix transcriptional regulator [Salipiger sp. 1_MG-2023]MDO6585539.1 helix-turn-helix transcriptional regulator [Salipiger sp. 1_MG-2023]